MLIKNFYICFYNQKLFFKYIDIVYRGQKFELKAGLKWNESKIKKTLHLRLEIDRKYLLKLSSTLVICYRKIGFDGLVSFQTVDLFVQSFYLVWFI